MNYPIASLSKSAKQWMLADRPSHVLHVFEHSCNLINDRGELFSLVSPVIRNGPFSAVLVNDIFPRTIENSDKVQIDKFTVHVGQLSFDTRKAKEWDASVNWSSLHNKKSKLLTSLVLIEELILRYAPPESFAEIVLAIPKNYADDDPIYRKAKKAISDLNDGIAENNRMAMRNGAKMLAGLGIGLTPAGDDYIIGTMLALFAWEGNDRAMEISALLANESMPLTNSISAAWLKTSMIGETGESWHELIEAIANDHEALVAEAVMRILPTGHTSGADALGAFVATIRHLSEQGHST